MAPKQDKDRHELTYRSRWICRCNKKNFLFPIPGFRLCRLENISTREEDSQSRTRVARTSTPEAYLVQSPNWWKHRESKLKKSSKNSEKNHECTSRSTPSTYKISWSNSSYSNSYKKDKFGLHLNVNDCQKICLFCNCKCKMNLIVEIYM